MKYKSLIWILVLFTLVINVHAVVSSNDLLNYSLGYYKMDAVSQGGRNFSTVSTIPAPITLFNYSGKTPPDSPIGLTGRARNFTATKSQFLNASTVITAKKLGFKGGKDNMSMFFWVNMNSGGSNYIYGQYTGVTNSSWLFLSLNNAGGGTKPIDFRVCNSAVTSSNTALWTTGNWFMLTATYQSNGTYKVYRNTTLVIEKACTTTPVRTSYWLGARGDGNYLTGFMDNVLIINKTATLGMISYYFNKSGNISRTPPDVTKPAVFDLRPIASQTYNVTNKILISANVTDNIAVSQAKANITYPSGGFSQVTLKLSTANRYNNTFTIPNTTGVYNITFDANDTVNNHNVSVKRSFTVRFKQNDFRPLNNQIVYVGNNITFSTNTTDNVAISSSFANISRPKVAFSHLQLTKVGTTKKFTSLVRTNISLGTWNITFDTNDSRNIHTTTVITIKVVNITNFNLLDAYSGTKINNSLWINSTSISGSCTADVNQTSGATGTVQGKGTSPASPSGSCTGTANYASKLILNRTTQLRFMVNTTLTACSVAGASSATTTGTVTYYVANKSNTQTPVTSGAVALYTDTVSCASGQTKTKNLFIRQNLTFFENQSRPDFFVLVNNSGGNILGNVNASKFKGSWSTLITASASMDGGTGAGAKSSLFSFADVYYANTKNSVATDSTKPTASDAYPRTNRVFNITNKIVVSINASDNIAVSQAKANITYPSGGFSQVTLKLGNTPKYNASFTIPNTTGRYNITFDVNDTNNNHNATVKVFFTANDTVHPVETGARPINATVFNITNKIQVSINVSDILAISTVFANISYRGAGFNHLALTFSSGKKYNNSFTIPNTTGRYNITFDSKDILGLHNTSAKTTFRANDITPPKVFDLRPLASQTYNVTNKILISTNVTDVIGVSQVKVNITRSSGTIDIITLKLSTANRYNNTYTIPNTTGTYTVRYIANDTSNNINKTVTRTFTVNDITKPIVKGIKPNSGITINTTRKLNISANVTDNVGVSSVQAWILEPFFGLVKKVLAFISNNLYRVEIAIPNKTGTYNVTFKANDTSNNINGTVTTSFIVNDLTRPDVKDAFPRIGSIKNFTTKVVISINATDNIAVSQAWANLTRPNLGFLRIQLKLSTTNHYNNSFTVPNITGKYNITFDVNDSSNVHNATVKTSFTSRDNVPPSITSSSKYDCQVNTNCTFFIMNVTDNQVSQGSLTNTPAFHVEVKTINNSIFNVTANKLFNTTYGAWRSFSATGIYNISRVYIYDNSSNMNRTTFGTSFNIIFTPTIFNQPSATGNPSAPPSPPVTTLSQTVVSNPVVVNAITSFIAQYGTNPTQLQLIQLVGALGVQGISITPAQLQALITALGAVGTPSQAGGGGASSPPVVVITTGADGKIATAYVIATVAEQNTIGGTGSYTGSLGVLADSKQTRIKKLVAYNVGVNQVNLSFSCDDKSILNSTMGFCSNVTISPKSVLLPPNINQKAYISVKMIAPDNFDVSKMVYFQIISLDQTANKGVIGFEMDYSKSAGYIFALLEKAQEPTVVLPLSKYNSQATDFSAPKGVEAGVIALAVPATILAVSAYGTATGIGAGSIALSLVGYLGSAIAILAIFL